RHTRFSRDWSSDVCSSDLYAVHLPEETEGSIVGAQVHAVIEDSSGDLWVGTTDALNVRRRETSLFEAFGVNKKAVNTIRSLVIEIGRATCRETEGGMMDGG